MLRYDPIPQTSNKTAAEIFISAALRFSPATYSPFAVLPDQPSHHVRATVKIAAYISNQPFSNRKTGAQSTAKRLK
jgi:hypothetical protein